MNKKLLSPLFWMGMISTVLLAAGVDFETLTSCVLLWDALISIAKNPVALLSCLVAIWAVWNDHSTKSVDIPFKK